MRKFRSRLERTNYAKYLLDVVPDDDKKSGQG